MKQKGFTLVELLGVIILLSILMLVAFPSIISVVKRANNKIDAATEELIISSTKEYIDKNQNNYPLTNDRVYCVAIETLIDNGYLEEDLIENTDNINTSYNVKISVENLKYKYEVIENCTSE